MLYGSVLEDINRIILKSRNNINNDDCFGDGNTEVKDDNATTKNVVSYYERSDDYLLQEKTPQQKKKNPITTRSKAMLHMIHQNRM